MEEDPRLREREAMRKMTLGEHLEELRHRLIISVVALVAGSLVFLATGSFPLRVALQPYHRTWTWLAQDWMAGIERKHQEGSLTRAEQAAHAWIFGQTDPGTGLRTGGMEAEILAGNVPDASLQTYGFKYSRRLAQLGPIEYIVAWMKVALIFGFMVASPIVFRQMWAFIAAGLYAHERRRIMSLLPYSVLLFLAGVAFSFLVMIPFAFYFLMPFSDSDLAAPNYTIREYFSFFFAVTLALGLVFQLPVLMIGMARFGLMSAASMAAKRKLFILGAFIAGALLTPPDPFTQILMAVPIIALFEAGLLFARRAERGRAQPGRS